MSIEYLCHACCDLLSIKSNEMAVNEAGRKSCYGCGDREDRRLHVADKSKLDPVIHAFNKKQQARTIIKTGPDRIAERLDELADLSEHWKRNRKKGISPAHIRGALIMISQEVLGLTEGHDAAVINGSFIRNLMVAFDSAREDADFDHDHPIFRMAEHIDTLSRDAARYQFLRDEDSWGEDSGDDCWEILGESHAGEFDEIVDSRMKRKAQS